MQEQNDLQKEIESQENNSTEQNVQHNEESVSTMSVLWEIIRFALLALIIVVPIRMYIASPFIVSGSSMDPTFGNGHYLIVDQISYQFEEPERGDVIIFKYPNDPSKFFIKRVIGLPGETVDLRNGITVIKNKTLPGGFTLDEPYVKFKKNDTMTITLAEDEYFMMGDNRKASSDSRVWGPLKEEFIKGEALLRLLPVTRIDTYPGGQKY
ncbi:signal peptidase I [Patescibacteria group bacterium]